ncbi:hypothetical protein HDU93_008462 [Gonapodya sp. JEL0774]|nr:hypothetical protein HDU93_008462 [Gonapodya sp. JEL0774]
MRPPSHPTHLSFLPHPPATIVLLSHPRHMYIHDVEKRRMADWSTLYNSPLGSQVPYKFTNKAEPLAGICCPVPSSVATEGLLQGSNSIAAWSRSEITWIDLSRHPKGGRAELGFLKRKRTEEDRKNVETADSQTQAKSDIAAFNEDRKRDKKNAKKRQERGYVANGKEDSGSDENEGTTQNNSGTDDRPHTNGVVENGDSEDVVVMSTDDEESTALNFMDVDDVPSNVEHLAERNLPPPAVEARSVQTKRPTKGKEARNFVSVDRYQPLMHADYLSTEELVVVERPWLGIAEKLPGVVRKKKYGT